MPRKRIEDGPNELRIVRESRGLSQMNAAELVGVSRPMWSSWECRARQMTIAQLNTIQEKLTPPLTDIEVEKIRKWWTDHGKPKQKGKGRVEEEGSGKKKRTPAKGGAKKPAAA